MESIRWHLRRVGEHVRRVALSRTLSGAKDLITDLIDVTLYMMLKSAEAWVKKALVIFALAVIYAAPARTQIKGCTSDIRTGVCNNVCSTKHLAGCTLEQLNPLLKIQSMECLTAAANKNFDRINRGLPDDGSFKRETATCRETTDNEIQEWKKSHPKKD